MHAVASENQKKEANIKEALEEQLAQVKICRNDINFYGKICTCDFP